MSFVSRLSRTGCEMAHIGTWLALEPSAMRGNRTGYEMDNGGTSRALEPPAMDARPSTTVQDRMYAGRWRPLG